MRPIKFRGHALHDSCGQKVDKFVFGDLCQGDGRITILDWDDGDNYEVEPETVAQLVGYDTNGKEIYEGDEIYNPGIMGYQDAQLINNYGQKLHA